MKKLKPIPHKNLSSGKTKKDLSIIKIGGNIVGDPFGLDAFLTLFAHLDGPKILVHGGGKQASGIAKKMGLQPRLINGRRITDAENLKVITMVYAGLINKTIVAKLQAKHCNAIGLSGADGNTIVAHKRPVKDVDFGFVGDVDNAHHENIGSLLKAGFIPVFCALTHDQNGQLLNTNADTIAAEIAIAMSASHKTTLYYCFEKKGVLNDITDENSVIEHINKSFYHNLLEKNVIADGMLPKLHNCFHALDHGTSKVCIGTPEMLTGTTTKFTTITP